MGLGARRCVCRLEYHSLVDRNEAHDFNMVLRGLPSHSLWFPDLLCRHTRLVQGVLYYRVDPTAAPPGMVGDFYDSSRYYLRGSFSSAAMSNETAQRKISLSGLSPEPSK